MSLDDLFRAWKEKAEGVGLDAAAKMCGAKLKRVGRELVGPCPKCGGVDRFSINVSKGKWNCRGSVGGSSRISMVMHITGRDFLSAGEMLAGEPPPRGRGRELTAEEKAEWEKAKRESEEKAERRKLAEQIRAKERSQSAQQVWMDSVPIAGTLAEQYLVKRGIPVPPQGWPGVLRFHGSLDYELDRSRQPMPAMVALVQDVAGEPTAVWQEYLNPKTAGKADVANPKLGRGPTTGGAIRIGGESSRIGGAEGVVTALAAWTIIRYSYPVWSFTSTAGMSAFEPPLSIEHITGWYDGDLPVRDKSSGEIRMPPGLKAWRLLEARCREFGVSTDERRPPRDGDWMDVLKELVAGDLL